jgi:hypothetical protein
MVHQRRRFDLMSAIQQILAAVAAAGGVAVTWDPVTTHADLALSGGDLTATRAAVGNGWCSGLATVAHSSGKHYFELLVSSGGSPPGVLVGLGSLSMANDSFVGHDIYGRGYYSDNGAKEHGGAIPGYGDGWDVGDVIGVAYDAGTGSDGTVEFFKNNVSQGVAFTDLEPGMYPAFSLFYGSSATVIVGRFKSADFSYSPPSGYSAWGA